MKRKSLFMPSLISRLVIALAILCVPLQVVGARSLDSIEKVETEGLSSAAASVPGVRFVHTATPDNITSNWTTIDHPLPNNNPNAMANNEPKIPARNAIPQFTMIIRNINNPIP